MTELKSDADVLKTKIDFTREDVRKLHPLLGLLEPQNPDQISGFAERLIQFMSEIDTSYREQAAELSDLKKEIRKMNAMLAYLIGDADPEVDG